MKEQYVRQQHIKLSSIVTTLLMYSSYIVSFLYPHATLAHEVYVLPIGEVAKSMSSYSPNPFMAMFASFGEFSLWGFVVGLLIITIFFVSISSHIERLLDPMLMKLKKWAPLLARLVLGSSLMISASSNALFGPELPLSHIWGSSGPFVQIALYSIGMAIAFGLFTRVCSFLALVLFTLAVSVYGWYMLTYINYVGEIVVTLILGGGMLSIDHRMSSKSLRSHTIAIRKFFAHIEPYAFLVLRVLFGLAIIYASWYAKIVHSNLALDVVADYHLTNYFHFSPLFLVLGAAIVETVIGIFIMFGLEVRFAALVFLGFLTMSIGFFGEVVWPHLVLYGINLVLIFHGYDRYTLEGHFFKKRTIEPVL